MINLPPNHMNLVQVKEFPHDPSMAVLYLRLKNDNDQYVAWYQTIQTKHGLAPSSKLEESLDVLAKLIDPDTDPFIDANSRITAPAKDQHWVSVAIPGSVPIAEYRLRHGLPEPASE